MKLLSKSLPAFGTCYIAMVLCIELLPAQTSMRFRQLSLEQGVGSNWVFSVSEDSLGFVWFSGFTGLTRHDGLNNVHYMYQDDDPESLPHNRVYRALPMPGERLLCSLIGQGFGLLDVPTGKFRHIHPTTFPNMPAVHAGTGLMLAPDDYLYLLGSERSLVRFNPFDSLSTFREIKLEHQSDRLYYRENKSRDILRDQHDPDLFWIIGNFRIYTYHSGTHTLTMRREFDQLLKDKYWFELINCAQWIDDEHLAFCLAKHGMYRYNVYSDSLSYICANPVLDPALPTVMTPSAGGHFWLGTSNGQLFKFFAEKGSFEEVLIHGVDMKETPIEGITESRKGALYIATNGQGVLKHHPSENRFRILAPEPLAPNIPFGFHFGMLHPRAPHFYANASQWPDRLFHFDLLDQSVTTLENSEIPNIHLGNFATGAGGEVIIHDGQTLYSIDLENHRLLPFDWSRYHIAAPEVEGSILFIEAFANGELLLLGEHYALHVGTNGEVRHVDLKALGATARIWEHVNRHPLGLLFISHRHVVLLPEDGPARKLLFKDKKWQDAGLNMRRLYTHDGESYLATTEHGLLRVSLSDDGIDVLQQYAAPKSLLSENIYTASDDGEGRYWLSTNLGFQRFDPSGRSDVRLGYRQNLPKLYRDNMLHINERGLCASLGRQHIVWSDIESLTGLDKDGRLILHSITAAEAEIPGFIHSGIADTLLLRHDQQLLELAWSHLGASSPDFYLVDYMMSEVDKQWQAAGDTYKARYTQLAPGTYDFEVRVRSVIDLSTLHAVHLHVIVQAPWWRATWFRIAIVLMAAILVYAFVRQRLDSIRKKETLVTAYNKQLAELEMQFLRSQMNPHFMFNSLNSIKHFILLNQKEKAVDYLTSFAQLIRSILHYSALNYISLAEELETLKTYIALEQARFGKSFTFEIEIAEELNARKVMIQPLIFQPYVENAIWHGLMHKEGDRKLHISLKREGEELVCSIADNGVGRERSQQLKSATRTRRSMGLAIAEKRIKSQDPRAGVHISDLYDAQGLPCGTQISIHLPLRTTKTSPIWKESKPS